MLKHELPMQNFTPDDYLRPNGQSMTRTQPKPATILFLKQFARMCNSKKQVKNGHNSFSVVACS